MRFVHVTECMAAGTLHVLRLLSGCLAKLGADQTIIYSVRAETPADVRELFPRNVLFREIPPARGLHVDFIGALSRQLRAELRDFRPDCLHLHSSKAGFIGRLSTLGVRAGTEVYYSPHGLSFLDSNRSAANAVYRGLERMANVATYTPVGCSPSEARMLQALTGRAARVLENPVDDEFFSVQRLDGGELTVASVGRISRQKGPERFAAMARRVRKTHPAARYIWIGDGDPDLRSLLIDAGCEVTGWKSRDFVMSKMSGIDVYVQSSHWEGLPISVLQAQAAGIPAVVTDVVGNVDAVSDGQSGFIVSTEEELASRVSALLDDMTLRQSFSSRAREFACQRFSMRAFHENVRRLYNI